MLKLLTGSIDHVFLFTVEFQPLIINFFDTKFVSFVSPLRQKLTPQF